jgi:hypothetical protein
MSLGVLEVLQVVQHSIAATVTVYEAPGRQQAQQALQAQGALPAPGRARLEISPPAAGAGSTAYRLALFAEDGRSVAVAVSQAEVYLLRNMLGTSLPFVTGWQYNLDPSLLVPALHLLPPYQPREQPLQQLQQQQMPPPPQQQHQQQQHMQPQPQQQQQQQQQYAPQQFQAPSPQRQASSYSRPPAAGGPGAASGGGYQRSSYSRPPYTPRAGGAGGGS